jgi:hypothetical protein
MPAVDAARTCSQWVQSAQATSSRRELLAGERKKGVKKKATQVAEAWP